MAYTYDLKVVVSGKQVELYKYKKTVWREYKTNKDEALEKKPKQLNIFEQEKLKKQRMQFSINRTKTEIRRLANSNPQLNKFMTLTFAKSTTDLKEANYIFNQFIKRIVYHYPDFEYLAVPEFQKDIDHYGRKKKHGGSVHYHLLCNIKTPDVKIKEKIYRWEQDFSRNYWKNGFIKIKNVEQINNFGAYMSKYLGKELFSGRMFGKKKFFRSQALSSPIEILGHYAQIFIEKFLSLLSPVFEKVFKSEWIGEVEYSAYSLDFIPFKQGVFERSTLFKPI
jgi:hypothetical protein